VQRLQRLNQRKNDPNRKNLLIYSRIITVCFYRLELRTSLPESSNNNLLLSPAELYISTLSEMSSSTSPSSKTSSSARSNSLLSHVEIMSDWKKKEIDEIHKKETHQYQYGAPPSSTTRTSPPQMFFKTPAQSHYADGQVAANNLSSTPIQTSCMNLKKKK
jgi:hypothetical protein